MLKSTIILADLGLICIHYGCLSLIRQPLVLTKGLTIIFFSLVSAFTSSVKTNYTDSIFIKAY